MGVKKKENEAEPDCGKHDFTQKEIKEFRSGILKWYDKNARKLPWRDIAKSEKNPDIRGYSVLVSEIMLQQTQVATVIDYFKRWMDKWPSTKELSTTTLESVNQAWSGLGYYSRGRRLQEGAKYVEEQLGGSMPRTRPDLLKLPGVGKYTASAVASIAFGAQVGVVDGNVLRVFARLRGIGAEIDNNKVVDRMWSLADKLVDPDRPGDFNQAVMELGATVCTPKTPLCSECPVKSICTAKKLNATSITDIEDTCFFCSKPNLNIDSGVLNYPRKTKKVASREESTLVVALSSQDSSGNIVYAIQQRPATGLLANLWELLTLPAREEKSELETVQEYLEDRKLVHTDLKKMGSVNHVFSHINMSYVVFTAELSQSTDMFEFVSTQEFLEKGTSTAMKKVVKFLTSPSSGSQKRKSDASAPDPKQRTINSFFKKVKKET